MQFQLHPKQGLAIQSAATEILYGGAAGGGKSHLMRVAALSWCAAIPGLQVYLFRRVFDDLIKNHIEGPKGFRAMLAEWENAGFVKIVDEEIRFWNGSKIFLCHCKDEKHVYKYFGAEMHVLLIDELTHFTDKMYRLLRSRVRMVGMKIPEEWRGMFPRILCSSNPGNVGHQFVKQMFIVEAEPFAVRQMEDEEGGMRRQFVPSRLEDNPSMQEDDPSYEKKLAGLGSDALVKALRNGDWDVVEGAFFDCWDRDKHVVRPFEIPAHWTRFQSGDWGSAKPFSFGWWAVASDDTEVENVNSHKLTIPRGCLVRYREWYGMKPKQPNVGLKLTAEEVGRGLVEREPATEALVYRVLDPSAFSENGGPSLEERIANGARETKRTICFNPADNTRVASRGALAGWDQVRARMKGDGDGRPMMVFFSNCLDSIRTIPALMHDSARPEDVDTDGEDHAADDVRYGCNSRPWVAPPPQGDKPLKGGGYKPANQEEGDSWR